MTDFSEAAARWGVEPGYHDVLGRWHTTTPLALRELTAALSAGRSAPAAVRLPQRRLSPGNAATADVGTVSPALRAAICAKLGTWRFRRSG